MAIKKIDFYQNSILPRSLLPKSSPSEKNASTVRKLGHFGLINQLN